MTPFARPRPVLARTLLLVATIATAVGTALVGGALQAARGDRALLAAADELDVGFRRQVAAVEALADDASEAFSDQAPIPALPSKEGGPRRRADHERALAAAFERARAILGTPKAPAGARISIYEEDDDPAAKSPWVLLGWLDTLGVHRRDLEVWPGRLPEPLLVAEHTRAEGAVSSYGVAWFQPDETGRVRLHRMDVYAHSILDPDDADASVEANRLVVTSAPFVPQGSATVRVRCDLDTQGLARGLPERAVGGVGAEGPTGDAIRPTTYPFRFPDPAPLPRARVTVAPPGVPWLVVGIGASISLLLLGALLAAGVGRRAAAAAQAPDITAEAAHELKTPLTAMRGQLEVALRRERSPAEYRETLAGTLEEVKGLQNLVASVLLLTRGAEGPRAEEPVDVTEVVRAEAERLVAAHPEREISLASVAGPRHVTGDPSLLARAIGNLLDNAALHSVAGGAIRIRCEASKSAVRVVVEDDGPGIPAARRERVFERFYRGPDVGQRGVPGSGLGLPIARWIVQVHGGTLVLDPGATDRARFVLEFPLR